MMSFVIKMQCLLFMNILTQLGHIKQSIFLSCLASLSRTGSYLLVVSELVVDVVALHLPSELLKLVLRQ